MNINIYIYTYIYIYVNRSIYPQPAGDMGTLSGRHSCRGGWDHLVLFVFRAAGGPAVVNWSPKDTKDFEQSGNFMIYHDHEWDDEYRLSLWKCFDDYPLVGGWATPQKNMSSSIGMMKATQY